MTRPTMMALMGFISTIILGLDINSATAAAADNAFPETRSTRRFPLPRIPYMDLVRAAETVSKSSAKSPSPLEAKVTPQEEMSVETSLHWLDSPVLRGGGVTTKNSDPATVQQDITRALQEIGMLSITDLFPRNSNVEDRTDGNDIAVDKITLMKSMASCLNEDNSNRNSAMRKETFPDGTIRFSVGSSWSNYSKKQQKKSSNDIETRESAGNTIMVPSDSSGVPLSGCRDLDRHSSFLRNNDIFQNVLESIVKLLQNELHLDFVPLLSKRSGEETSTLNNGDTKLSPPPAKPSLTLLDIVQRSDIIEHYHAYYYNTRDEADHSQEEKYQEKRVTGNEENMPRTTMDWHVDQGLFLLFTPGMMVTPGDKEREEQDKEKKATDGLFIQLRDGSTVMVDFDAEQDDIVLMLGDGVDQFVNPAISAATPTTSTDSILPLRAVPHAFVMPKEIVSDKQENQMHDINSPRLWYGRMVLPPPSAQHPLHKEWTYGELRQAITMERQIHDRQQQENDSNPSALSMGCSSPNMRVLHNGEDHSQDKNASAEANLTCDDNTFPCWHQCQAITAGETAADCESKGEELACVRLWDVVAENDNETTTTTVRLLWDGSHQSKEFFPGCINKSNATVFDPSIHHGEKHNESDSGGDDDDDDNGDDTDKTNLPGINSNANCYNADSMQAMTLFVVIVSIISTLLWF